MSCGGAPRSDPVVTNQILIVAAGAAAAGFVQGLTGFAFGLVALAIWAWALEPALAAPLVVFGSIIGQLLGIKYTRAGWRGAEVAPFIIGGIAGVPLGVWLLRFIDPVVFKACVGAMLMIWCPVMLFSRNIPVITWGGRFGDACAGWVGGVMGGIGGLTGPAPILWTTLRGWDRDRQRGVFQAFNLCMHSLTMTVYIVSGTIPRESFALFWVVGPAILVPAVLGGRLYPLISDLTFRRVILGLLTASGVVLIVSSARALL